VSYMSPILQQAGADRWLDVDFDREAEAQGRLCGCLPMPDRMRASFEAKLPVYEAAFPVYPRAQWPDLIAERDANQGAGWIYRRIRRGHDQDGEGTCVYNMLSLGMQIAWCQAFGDHVWIPFSPVSGYRWNAPGPRTGSNVWDSIVWSENHGLLPEDTPENKALVAAGYFGHTHPAVGYGSKFQSGWEETAKLFRASPQEQGGWYRVTTVEGWFSALFDGRGCGGGRDSHAIWHVGATIDGSSVRSIYCNSWGKWGATLQGSDRPITSFGFDSEAKVRTMVSRGAFCLVSMRRPTFLDRWIKDLAA